MGTDRGYLSENPTESDFKTAPPQSNPHLLRLTGPPPPSGPDGVVSTTRHSFRQTPSPPSPPPMSPTSTTPKPTDRASTDPIVDNGGIWAWLVSPLRPSTSETNIRFQEKGDGTRRDCDAPIALCVRRRFRPSIRRD